MTYQILLVDDESIDLEWLRRRIEGQYEKLHIVDAVNSSFQARSVLEERHIDILLTDIRMPIMTGLELAKEARKLQPHIKIVFISGHEDFGYAKQAIHMSAVAYMLKPVDNQELSEMLQELIDRLDQERKPQLSDKDDQWMRALPVLQKEFILRWLEGLASEQVQQAAFDAIRHLDQSRGLTVSLVEIDDLNRMLMQMEDEEREALSKRVQATADSFFEGRRTEICIRDNHSRIVLISDADETAMKDRLSALADHMRDRLQMTITAGIGSQVSQIEHLAESYTHAKQAVARKLFFGKDRIFAFSDKGSHKQPEPVSKDIQPIVDAMFESMLQYQLVDIDERLEELFKRAERFEDKTTINNFIVHIVSRLQVHCQSIQENLYQILGWELENLNVLNQFETIHDMKSWLRRKLFELSEKLYIRRQKHTTRIIDDIIAYVHDQLANKVTLKQVAEHFNFSPNYLGVMFREATGEHFSGFLIRARLKLACEMLLDPQLKIYEVADRIGYKNMLYFNRQFKKYIGRTPGEYRKSPFPVQFNDITDV